MCHAQGAPSQLTDGNTELGIRHFPLAWTCARARTRPWTPSLAACPSPSSHTLLEATSDLRAVMPATRFDQHLLSVPFGRGTHFRAGGCARVKSYRTVVRAFKEASKLFTVPAICRSHDSPASECQCPEEPCPRVCHFETLYSRQGAGTGWGSGNDFKCTARYRL